MNGRTS